MTTPETAVETSVRTAATAPSVDALLQQMGGLTITEGWDVISAMAAERVNALLAQQYVANLATGDTLDPINATVQVLGSYSVQFVDLVLGPPLLSFSPTLAPQLANLLVDFVSGTVNVVQAQEGGTTVLSSQVVLPGDGYALTGVVPLASVQGLTGPNHHDVVIDIANGVSFSANLGVTGEGAATTLGTYFLDVLKDKASKFVYSLGTLSYDDKGSNLTPVKFDFATQVDATDSSDQGRLLLFVATTYNPGGGTQTSLPVANVIPQGYSAALIVSSQVVFQEILLPALQPQVQAWGGQLSAPQPNAGQAWRLTGSGSMNLGVVRDQATWSADSYFSGEATSDTSANEESVNLPLDTLQVSASSDGVLIYSLDQGWEQGWVHGCPAPHLGIVYDGGSVSMNATANLQSSGYVDPATDIVTFSGNANVNVSVTFDHSTIWQQIFGDGGASDRLASDVANQVAQALPYLLNFSLPQVNTFAVSNLLFPGSQSLSLQAVHVPGDLLILGEVLSPAISVSPLQATLTPGETVQLTATAPAGRTVTWKAVPPVGTVSAAGLYTAPATIDADTPPVVALTASLDANTFASAAVTLVPAGVLVSPAFALLTGVEEAQPFSAVVAGDGGQAVTWAAAGGGTITAAGAYTPPASVTAPTAVTVTATSQADPKESGSALLVLLETLPSVVSVSPPLVSAPLAPGATQHLTATMMGGASGPTSVKWSVLPAGAGTIDDTGLYTAPDQVSALQPVLVLATSTSNPPLTGTALLYIAPAAD